MAQDTVFSEKIEQIFNPEGETMIMGILNITPDSFSDGGKYLTEKEWLKQCRKMVKEGADIIDIGGFSTRPGAKWVSIKEEENRVLPVIKSVRKHFPELLISVDTFRASIAQKAVNAGANIINDISGGQFDKKMFTTVARLDVPYVLMHNNKTWETMHDKKIKGDVIDSVKNFIEKKYLKLIKMGATKIIIDTGFGFGKTEKQNFELITRLKLIRSHNQPILAGISRKSMIPKTNGEKPKDVLKKISGMHFGLILSGATILRVHDVKEAKEILKLLS